MRGREEMHASHTVLREMGTSCEGRGSLEEEAALEPRLLLEEKASAPQDGTAKTADYKAPGSGAGVGGRHGL